MHAVFVCEIQCMHRYWWLNSAMFLSAPIFVLFLVHCFHFACTCGRGHACEIHVWSLFNHVRGTCSTREVQTSPVATATLRTSRGARSSMIREWCEPKECFGKHQQHLGTLWKTLVSESALPKKNRWSNLDRWLCVRVFIVVWQKTTLVQNWLLNQGDSVVINAELMAYSGYIGMWHWN